MRRIAAVATVVLLSCGDGPAGQICLQHACWDPLQIELRSSAELQAVEYRIELDTTVGSYAWTCDFVTTDVCEPDPVVMSDDHAKEVVYFGSLEDSETRTVTGFDIGVTTFPEHGATTGPDTVDVRMFRDGVLILETHADPMYDHVTEDGCGRCVRADRLELAIE